ncbi:hypothetical protein GpartN1_g2026.t1 [Galdieria partita]|uniref:Pescadillo homolog n=1 Tax=Galdieria partita TaxID=83374 RepID=A0A9C7PTK7_9RHOD|nr:hypothetical protein GpartN1_g2026.t1 [Galdieria partita]
MAKKKQQPKGAGKAYISAAKARRKLQVSLATFQKLCILKGIHPRVPGKKLRGSQKTFYLTKDIKFLAHDPLIRKAWEMRAQRRKIKKAKAKKENLKVKSLLNNFPSYRLERVVLERYGTFRDALLDLDDALNVLFMVSNLTCTSVIDSDRIANCKRLCREFLKYVTTTGGLRKVFASVKGLYVQVDINGVFPVFIIPYRPFQSIPKDIDQKIIKSFLEFYECLLSCVNRHLFYQKGYVYPPKFDESLEAKGFSVFDAFTLEWKKGESQLIVDEESDLSVSENLERDKNMDHPNRLLEGMTFFLGREVPIELFDFIVRSCGGNALWEVPGIHDADSSSITHYVYDRPNIPGDRRLDADYVQPQWILDSINAGILLPVSLYLPGVSLPPHLSPFVSHENSSYRPHFGEFISGYKSSQVTGTYTEKVIGQESTKDDKLDATSSQITLANQEEEEEEEDKRQRALVPNDKLKPSSETQNRKLAKMMMRSKDRYRYERIMRSQKKETKATNRLLRRQKELKSSE